VAKKGKRKKKVSDDASQSKKGEESRRGREFEGY